MLRPGGRLAAFWHVFEPPQDVAEAVAAVYRRVVPDSPFGFGARPRQAEPRQPAPKDGLGVGLPECPIQHPARCA